MTSPTKPASVTISGSTTGAVQASLLFTATVAPVESNLPITYTWQASEQAPVTHSNDLSDSLAFTWNTLGVKTITVTATNSQGTVTNTFLVTIKTPPAAVTLSGPVSGLIHTGYSFTAATSPANTTLPLTYTWQASDQTPVTHTADLSDTLTFTWDTPGTKTITVTATNEAGTVSSSHLITVNVPPAAVTLSGPVSGLIHTDYSFTTAVSPTDTTLPLTYTWQASDQTPVTHTTGLSDTLTFTWGVTGTQLITVTVTNSSGVPVQTSAEVLIAAPAEEQQRIYLPLVVKGGMGIE